MGGLEATGRIARQRPHGDRVELRRHVGAQRAGRLDPARAHSVDSGRVAVTVEEAGAGEALPQRDAQTENVRAPIDGPALQLFRGAIAVLALEHARNALLLLGAAHHPEVQQLHDAVIGDEDVARADVAMNEPDRFAVSVARLVCVVQPLRRLLGERCRDVDRHGCLGAARDDRGQVLAGQIFHADEVIAVDFAQLVGRDDVGMFEARGDPRFVEKHFAQLFAVSQMRLDSFERDHLDESLDAPAFGDVEAAHSALAEETEQLIAPEGLRDVSRRLRRVRRMSSLDHAQTLSSLNPARFRTSLAHVLPLSLSARVAAAATQWGAYTSRNVRSVTANTVRARTR